MPRVKEFDPEDVLDKAMRLFWRQGYEATSIQDLVETTGINRASMYDTFGDKHHLFLAALDHYVAKHTAARLEILSESGSALAALHRFFDELIIFSLGKGKKMGCLLTNSVVELAPHHGNVRDRVRGVLEQVEDAFYQALLRAQQQGEIGSGRDLRALARFLLGTLQGIRVLARGNPQESVLRDIVQEALHGLEAPALKI